METMFDDAMEPLTAFVKANAGSAGPIVFLICFAESLAIVTLFVPATVMLFAIGGLATAGLLDLGELSLWGTAGAGLGYWASYAVGRRYGREIEALPWLARRPQLVARGHRFFERWGALAVGVSRFVGPARVVVPLFAGSMGVSPRTFHIANWLSAALWAPAMLAPTAIAAWLTAELQALSPAMRSSVMILLIALAIFAWREFRKKA